MDKLKVLGVSAGNGVILYPFESEVVGNIEIRSVFQTENDQQWKLNFPKAKLFKAKDIKERLPKFKDIDIIMGHPNCGAGSILRLAKSKSFTSSRGDLSIDLFFRAVKKYKPKYFLFENLVALFNSYSKEEFKTIFKGYNLIFHSGSVSQWGNSQIGRKRLVIIGIREDQNIKSRAFALPKQENIKLKTAGALEKLLKYQISIMDKKYINTTFFNVREPDDLVMHMEKNFKRLNLAQIREEWNKSENLSKKSFDATTHGKGRMKTIPGVYRNKSEDYPRAVLRNNRQFDPNGNIMSPRQLANIQGINITFGLYYDPERLHYCLNKARVTIAKSPPADIGRWFYHCICQIQFKEDKLKFKNK